MNIKSRSILDHPKYITFFVALLLIMGLYQISSRASAQVQTTCTSSNNLGSISGSFEIPSNGTYRAWSRMMPGTTGNDSYALEIDGKKCFARVGDTNIAANAWTWVDYYDANTTLKTTFDLTQGSHTYKAYGREPGVKLDKILLVSDTVCLPKDTGTNCHIPANINNYDLVVSSVIADVDPVTVNKPVRFGAVITNQGKTATPAGVIHGIAFNVNGTLVSWSDTFVKALAPNESVTLMANGGPNNGNGLWTPTGSGTISVLADVDNIDRIKDEAVETNNKTTRTFTVAAAQPTPTPTPPTPTPPTPTPVPTTDVVKPEAGLVVSNVSVIPPSKVISNATFLDIAATASDASGIKSLNVYVNGARVTLTNNTYKTPSINGDYVVRIEATDNNNLVSIVENTYKVRHPDVDRSGAVNARDISLLLRNFNKNDKQYDFNADGLVGAYDVRFMLTSWTK